MLLHQALIPQGGVERQRGGPAHPWSRRMFEAATYSGERAEDYALVNEQARHLWENDLPLASNLANISALLKQFLARTNWVGFYLTDRSGSQLVVGPFQGLPACTKIAFGKGVCGTAAVTRMT